MKVRDIVNTHSEDGVWGLIMPILKTIDSNSRRPRAFIKRSASYFDDWTKQNQFVLDCVANKVTSLSMCFVFSWKTRLIAMCKANWLSQWRSVGSLCGISKSLSSCFNHLSSYNVKAMHRYSDSADERETTVCFFTFHKIGEVPKVTN